MPFSSTSGCMGNWAREESHSRVGCGYGDRPSEEIF